MFGGQQSRGKDGSGRIPFAVRRSRTTPGKEPDPAYLRALFRIKALAVNHLLKIPLREWWSSARRMGEQGCKKPAPRGREPCPRMRRLEQIPGFSGGRRTRAGTDIPLMAGFITTAPPGHRHARGGTGRRPEQDVAKSPGQAAPWYLERAPETHALLVFKTLSGEDGCCLQTTRESLESGFVA